MHELPIGQTLENKSLVVDLGLLLLSATSHTAFHMTNVLIKFSMKSIYP